MLWPRMALVGGEIVGFVLFNQVLLHFSKLHLLHIKSCLVVLLKPCVSLVVFVELFGQSQQCWLNNLFPSLFMFPWTAQGMARHGKFLFYFNFSKTSST